jgi:hypothetical protein
MHLVKKKIKGKTYLYMYESYRENGKVKKRMVSYIGPEGMIKD